MNLDDRHNGQSIEVSRGEILTLRLPENPTTGFRWTLCGEPSGLEPIEDRYESGGSAPGAAGIRVLDFRAAKPGDSNLYLKNVQAWGSERPAAQFRVRIRVR